MTPWSQKKPKKSFYSIRTYVNISRSPNASTLILVPKHFYIWCYQNFLWTGQRVLELSPFFTFLTNFEKFQFFGIISRALCDTLGYPGTNMFPLMTRKLLMSSFCSPVFYNGGVRQSLSFSIIWIIWWPHRDKLIHPWQKCYCLCQ